MELEAVKMLAGALAMLPALGATIGLGLYFKSYAEAVGRNPQAESILSSKFIIKVAFIEALGIIPVAVGMILLLG